MTLSCVAPRCALPRRHVPGCDREHCRGCLPALAEVGRLCPRCFQRAGATLTDIGELYGRLDDVLVPGMGGGQRVSGTPERTVPINLDAHDLLASSRLGTVHDNDHDQVGQPSVAAVLEMWCRDWAERLDQRTRTLEPNVIVMLRWLRARLEWAAKTHAAVDVFIVETRDLRHRLVTVLGELDQDAERLCRGVACKGCDMLTLYRRTDGSGDVECHNLACRMVYRADEYQRWIKLLDAAARRIMSG